MLGEREQRMTARTLEAAVTGGAPALAQVEHLSPVFAFFWVRDCPVEVTKVVLPFETRCSHDQVACFSRILCHAFCRVIGPAVMHRNSKTMPKCSHDFCL